MLVCLLCLNRSSSFHPDSVHSHSGLNQSHMSALDHILIGKYCGRSYAAVAEADRNYCSWVIGTRSLPRSLLPFKRWLKAVHGGVMPYGKHKNSFFSEVFRDHEEYTDWCCQLDNPSDVMLEFQKYIRGRGEEEAASEDASKQSPPKRTRRSPPREQAARTTSCLECKVCFDEPANVLLIPCKHLVLCEACAALSLTCPICRGKVSETLLVYPG